jgi:single-strand DNA-binding protein
MAKSFNQTIIIGRLGNDPEMSETKRLNPETGNPLEIAKFKLSNTVIKDGKEEIQWHDLVAFGKQAILCHDYLHKGDLCCVEGRLDRHQYKSQDGEEIFKTTIIAERITFLQSSKRKETNNEVSGNEE